MSTSSDIFLSYNREDQAVARRFAETFEREALRRLRAADPGSTLELWEARHRSNLLHVDTAAELFATFRKVWLRTPPESPAA